MTMSELTLLVGRTLPLVVGCLLLLLHIINSMFLAACGPCFPSSQKKNKTSRRVAEPLHKGDEVPLGNRARPQRCSACLPAQSPIILWCNWDCGTQTNYANNNENWQFLCGRLLFEVGHLVTTSTNLHRYQLE